MTYSGQFINRIIADVDRVTRAQKLQRAIETAFLLRSLGECSGVSKPGSALYDYQDAEPCTNPAVVVCFVGEMDGLGLCEKCYRRMQ